jgi:hypothetical protein
MLSCIKNIKVGDILYMAMHDGRLLIGYGHDRARGIGLSTSVGIYPVIEIRNGAPVAMSRDNINEIIFYAVSPYLFLRIKKAKK